LLLNLAKKKPRHLMRLGLIHPILEGSYIIRPPRQRTHQVHERFVRLVVVVVVMFAMV
jgi:hypothetical protein